MTKRGKDPKVHQSRRPTILRSNANGVYAFLCRISWRLPEGERLEGKRILDCGAAGALPPLAVFAEQGMDCVGIDISEPRLEQSRAFASKRDLPIEFLQGDMRSLPFDDESFDYVYEDNSIFHLGHSDTTQAISEMCRVLRPGGLAQFEVVSRDSWPRSPFGEERARGEFWMVIDEEAECHSMFDDDEADALISFGNLLSKVQTISTECGDCLSEEDWNKLHLEAPKACSLDEWMAAYPRRMELIRYIVWRLLVEKPG